MVPRRARLVEVARADAANVADLKLCFELWSRRRKWWLYDRLICLGGERCAVGIPLSVEPPEGKSGLDAFDTDYSMNLLLCPHWIGDTQDKVEGDGVQGELIKEQPDIQNNGLDWQGEFVQLEGDPKTAVLHCEFEGGGVYKLYQAAQAALAFATAAVVACAIPVLGWVACAVLGVIAAVIALAGIAEALGDKGRPTDVSSKLAELHPYYPKGNGADVLVVKGEWVYDSAHEGWNEIHPIRQCQQIAFTYDQPIPEATTRYLVREWCGAIDDANAPTTKAAQAQPQNQWESHPVIDGCDPEPAIK
jgi:hypothetical protein